MFPKCGAWDADGEDICGEPPEFVAVVCGDEEGVCGACLERLGLEPIRTWKEQTTCASVLAGRGYCDEISLHRRCAVCVEKEIQDNLLRAERERAERTAQRLADGLGWGNGQRDQMAAGEFAGWSFENVERLLIILDGRGLTLIPEGDRWELAGYDDLDLQCEIREDPESRGCRRVVAALYHPSSAPPGFTMRACADHARDCGISLDGGVL